MTPSLAFMLVIGMLWLVTKALRVDERGSQWFAAAVGIGFGVVLIACVWLFSGWSS